MDESDESIEIKETTDAEVLEGEDGSLALVYELGYHLLPSVVEEEMSSKIANIQSHIKKRGGIVISEELPRKIDLAYTMRRSIAGKYEHFDSAYFGWIKFKMTGEEVVLLQEELSGVEDILRFLLIKTTLEDTIPVKNIIARPDVPRKEIIRKPKVEEKKVPVSEEELDKSIKELVSET